MFAEVNLPMKLTEMDPVFGNMIFSDEKVSVFEHCLGQLKERLKALRQKLCLFIQIHLLDLLKNLN